MIDRGLSIAEVDGLLEVAGACVDIVKLGWGTAIVSANLAPKLERYAAHGIPVVLGGTLTELAIRQNRVDGLGAHDRRIFTAFLQKRKAENQPLANRRI